jgi:hypothetical protein
MKFAKIIIIALAVLTAGCAQNLGSHQVSLQAVESLRADAIPAMRVGTFALSPGRNASMDKSVQIRSVSLSSPDDGSFAVYLGKALETDLRAAGKLDQNSNLIVQGLLTDSGVDAGISTGDAVLGAKFSLLRNGETVFDKEITVRSKWASSFVGAEAIPEAINQYTALYDKLVLQLVTDGDFKLAVAPAVSLNTPLR